MVKKKRIAVHVHALNRGLRARRSRKRREGRGGALERDSPVSTSRKSTKINEKKAHGLLDVGVALARGERRGAKVLGLRRGDDVRAVDQVVRVLAQGRDRVKDELEVRGELALVVCVPSSRRQ